VWSQEFSTREEAKEAEARIKGWSRAKKEALVRGDYEALRPLSKKRNWAGYRQRKAAGNRSADDPGAVTD